MADKTTLPDAFKAEISKLTGEFLAADLLLVDGKAGTVRPTMKGLLFMQVVMQTSTIFDWMEIAQKSMKGEGDDLAARIFKSYAGAAVNLTEELADLKKSETAG